MHWITEEVKKRLADERLRIADLKDRDVRCVRFSEAVIKSATLQSLLDWIEEREDEALDDMVRRSEEE